jgi:SnoaL-like protein
MSGGRIVAVGAAIIVVVLAVRYLVRPADETARVRQRLEALVADVNRSTTDGQGMEARSAQLGDYFTDDVEIDLGQGAVPIQGKATLLAMAVRLQPRTAAFELRFADIGVTLGPGGDTASVHLTAEFIRRSITTGEQSLDAREFTLKMRATGGDWRIAQATLVETLKQN